MLVKFVNSTILVSVKNFLTGLTFYYVYIRGLLNNIHSNSMKFAHLFTSRCSRLKLTVLQLILFGIQYSILCFCDLIELPFAFQEFFMKLCKDGEASVKNIWKQGDANSDARPGCSWKNQYPCKCFVICLYSFQVLCNKCNCL